MRNTNITNTRLLHIPIFHAHFPREEKRTVTNRPKLIRIIDFFCLPTTTRGQKSNRSQKSRSRHLSYFQNSLSESAPSALTCVLVESHEGLKIFHPRQSFTTLCLRMKVFECRFDEGISFDVKKV